MEDDHQARRLVVGWPMQSAVLPFGVQPGQLLVAAPRAGVACRYGSVTFLLGALLRIAHVHRHLLTRDRRPMP